jgi:DNA-binding transcriptional regulator PaaX
MLKNKILNEISDKRANKGEVAKKILLTAAGIAAIGVVAGTLIVLPGFGIVLKPFADWYKKQNRHKQYQIRKTFEQLRRERLIGTTEINGQTKMVLSENGKKRTIKYELESMTIPKPNKWDKKWRLVIFDVPEKFHKARRALRIKLNELGFYPLQKSVWLYPYGCRNEIDFITEFFQISPYVRIIEAVNFDGDNFLKKEFELV